MKKPKILLPLGRQFVIILILFIFCTAGIILFTAGSYARLQTSFLDSSLESYSSQLAKNTIEAYKNYENVCYSIAANQVVQNYLMPSGASQGGRKSYGDYLQLENQLSTASLLSSNIVDIAVYGQNEVFAALNGASANYRGFAHALSESRFAYCCAGTASIDGIYCHILAMPIYSFGTGESHYLGILFLAVDMQSLFNTTPDSSDREYNPEILFLNETNQLVYGNERLYRHLSDTIPLEKTLQLDESAAPVTYAVRSYAIPNIGHTLYVLIDLRSSTRLIFSISGQLLLCMSGLMLLILLLLCMLYRPLIRSLKQLTEFMNNISAGDRRAYKKGAVIRQGLVGTREIDDIFTAFNDMLLQTDKLNHTIFDTYVRMYELENNNRLTEIAFLRSQVNPHFLYNTLTMICGMAAEGMNDKIISVTGALSQIFRYSIKGSEMVTLREEMEIVRSYLMIQQERFEGRFSVRYDFFEDSLDCLIPRMIVQPLVENAIVHGLEKSLNPGRLRIGAGRNPEHGYLAIWIFDTGVGMPESKLSQLRETISRAPGSNSKNAAENLARLDASSHESIGILNVNSRMVLYYGSDYTLLIDSEEGVGTNIQIRVPYRTQ